MSIALLNVVCEHIKERRYDKPNYPDPSLGAVFSYLKKSNIECYVIDSKLRRMNLGRIIERIRQIRPQVIGFTSFTHEIERVASVARTINGEFQNAKLIIGGAHANAMPGEVLSEFPIFDIAIFGEGEQTLVELVRNDFRNLESIQGMAYRKGADIIVNKPRPFLDIENIPATDWTEFPKARYYPIFTSRGCPYKCVFCSRPFGSKIRHRPVESIIQEIEQTKKLFSPRMIYFWDENFCIDRTKTINLLEQIRKNKEIKDIKWFCQTHINHLDYELLRLMKESGCKRIGIGIESGNEEVLRRICKDTNKDRIIQIVKWLKKVKIPFEGYFLLGLPDENWETCVETIKFATKLNPTFPVFGIAVPYPGTEIYNMARRGEGGYKLIATNWSDYNKLIGKAVELTGLSRRQLEILQLYGYVSVLVKNLRIIDIVRFIFQYGVDIRFYIINFLSNFKIKDRDNKQSYANRTN